MLQNHRPARSTGRTWVSGRRRRRLWPALALQSLLAFATGCPMVSQQPLRGPDDPVVLEPSIVGTWRGREPNAGDIRIEQASPSTYRVLSPSSKLKDLTLVLVKVGAHLYGQFSGMAEQGRPTKHVIIRLKVEKDRLHMGVSEQEWLIGKVKASDPDLKGEISTLFGSETDLTVTSSTEELKRFLLRHADDPEAFRWSALERVPEPGTAPRSR